MRSGQRLLKARPKEKILVISNFSYVEDTCLALVLLAECNAAIGKTVNIGSNFEISIADTFDLIVKIMNAKVRLIRNNVVVRDNMSMDSLKHFKDDAREVKAGLECGIKLAGFDDIKMDDVLEFYEIVKVARTL